MIRNLFFKKKDIITVPVKNYNDRGIGVCTSTTTTIKSIKDCNNTMSVDDYRDIPKSIQEIGKHDPLIVLFSGVSYFDVSLYLLSQSCIQFSCPIKFYIFSNFFFYVPPREFYKTSILRNYAD